MVSSLARYRHLLRKEPSENTRLCVFDEHARDRTRDEIFPHFNKDLYFSKFPVPPNVTTKSIDSNKQTDPGQVLKFGLHLGSGRFGKSYTAQRIDLTPYASSIAPKPNPKLMVAVTKMDVKRVSYVDAVRTAEPFMLAGHDISYFLDKVLLSFRTSLPYMAEYYYLLSPHWPHALSLCHRLQQVGRMTEDEARFYIVELVDAVACVHRYGKVIRRLCICNMLIDQAGHLKLVAYTNCDQNLDCGQACNMLVKNCGDQFYAAPEVVFGTDVHAAADWWSVGVILYQLLTGELPFTGRTLGDLGKAITEHVLVPDLCLSGEATAFLKHMLHKDPRRRLGFSETQSVGDQGTMNVKDHPFFQKVLWRNVMNVMEIPPFLPPKAPSLLMDLYNERITTMHGKLSKMTQS